MPHKDFYTLAQISKFVRPGSRVIGVSGSPGPLNLVVCFNDPLGQLTLVGMNNDTSVVALSGTLSSLPTINTLDSYYTTSETNLAQGPSIQVSSNAFDTAIPADCVFTLTGAVTLPRLSITIASNSVVISWLARPTCVLEAAESVNAGWSVVTNVPQAVGQEQRVTVEPTASQLFFRLRLQ
jgi:hypothetical protein